MIKLNMYFPKDLCEKKKFIEGEEKGKTVG